VAGGIALLAILAVGIFWIHRQRGNEGRPSDMASRVGSWVKKQQRWGASSRGGSRKGRPKIDLDEDGPSNARAVVTPFPPGMPASHRDRSPFLSPSSQGSAATTRPPMQTVHDARMVVTPSPLHIGSSITSSPRDHVRRSSIYNSISSYSSLRFVISPTLFLL
jgi:hypothetical protein